MIPDALRGFLPGGLQSAKQLVTYAANFFFALFAVQVLGLDLTRYGIAPAVDWRTAGVLFVAFAVAQAWLGNKRDEQLEVKITETVTGTGSQPPAPTP